VIELDKQFGPTIPPQNGGLKSWERGQQVFCYELNQASAKQLSDLFDAARGGSIGLRIATAVTFIWIVTADGLAIFALEETVEINGTSRMPRMKGVPLNGNVKPLGHPLLVNGEAARIAGELYLDCKVIDADLTWVLNNRSGRYGVHRTRTTSHLENAADLFRRYGLKVETEYFEASR
jgi:hypothetical protein